MSVTFVDSVLSKLRAAASSGIFLVLRLDGRPDRDAVLAQTREAVAAANAEAAPRTVLGSFTGWTPRGVAVALHAAPMVSKEQRAAVRGWLTTFTTRLSQAGLSGRVGPSGIWGRDLDALLSTGLTYPAAFVGYRVETYAPWSELFHGWQVDQETTRLLADRIQARASRIPDAHAWALLAGPGVAIAATDIADYLATTAAVVRNRKGVYVVRDDKTALDEYSLASLGQCVTHRVDPAGGWHTLLEVQRNLLLLAPEAVDVGMIKNARSSASSWEAANHRGHHQTVRDPLDYQLNRHLWDEYVIDAAGISLLTDKHLQHARDLSDWTIEEVAPDRFLLSAPDLEPWYAGTAAPPEIVEKARADSGDMILTWDTILANPGPYTSTHPSVVGR